MRALLCTQFGGFDRLEIVEIPSPRPGPRQVRIDVKAASVSFPDALIVQGLYQTRPSLPFVPGTEFAGVVVEVGAGVSEFAPGDRVAGFGLGGLAEEALADVSRTIALPDSMGFELGVALLVSYGTALHGLRDCARLTSGETLLVLGAAGGAGHAAVQIGRALGAHVIAAASSDAKLALCRQLGAAAVINYSTEDLRERIKVLTAGRGVDVVYDPVGGPYTEQALRATAWGGRLLVIGFASGEIAKIPLNLCLLKERSLIGVYFGEAVRRDPQRHGQNVAQLLQWFACGKIKPHISARVPLTGAAQLLARVAAREISGKAIVLPEGGEP